MALALSAHGVEASGTDLDITEIQADTVLEVAQDKARKAFAILSGRPWQQLLVAS